jgi:sterol 3beta-glucosyltransferase
MAQAGTMVSKASMGKKIMVMTFGSRGDTQPYVALCAHLKASGLDVLVTTNTNNVTFYEKFGIAAHGVHFDMEDYLQNDEAIQGAMSSGSVFKFQNALYSKLSVELPKAFPAQWKAAKQFKPDIIIAYAIDYYQAQCIAQVLGVPCALAAPTPLALAAVSKHVETEMKEPCCHDWVALLLLKGMQVMTNRLGGDSNLRKVIRTELKELDGAPLQQDHYPTFVMEWMNPLAFQLVASSEMVTPKPPDFPKAYAARTHYTGFWVISKKEQLKKLQQGDSNFGGTEGLAAIEKFVAEGKGKKPAYLGWGSMVSVSPEHMTALAVKALQLAGMRGIILGGFAQLNESMLRGHPDEKELREYARGNVLFLQSAPHEWLFPQCSAIVHHGGAGTTAAALRSGVPCIVTPIFVDQFDNANMTQQSGAGIGVPQFSKISSEDLAGALTTCTTDAVMIQRACSLGASLQDQDGLSNAVKVIDTFVAEELVTGKWRARFDAMMERRYERPVGIFGLLRRMCCRQSPFDDEEELVESL